jgi:ABC-type transport system involved in cytochrome c biogenesis permease subunit
MNQPQGKSRAVLWVPILFLALSVLYLASAFRPQSNDTAFDLVGFGNLPVVDRGRVKPIDTYARISLMMLSNKQTLFMGEDAATSAREHPGNWEKSSAVHWLLDVVTRPDVARRYTVIRIDHPDILGLLHIHEERQYFSMHELLEHRDVLVQQFDMVQKANPSDLTTYQRHIQKLSNRLNLYLSLEGVMSWFLIPEPGNTESWQTLAAVAPGGDFHGPGAQDVSPDEFETVYGGAVRTAMDAWHDGDAVTFNEAVQTATALLQDRPEVDLAKVHFESYFNHASPFIKTMGLYVLVFLLAALSWLAWSRPLARAALWVLVLAFAVHTVGLASRIWMQGRPPVTNLYSSAVFVGWGAGLLGAILERIFRSGIGAVTAAAMGFLTLLIAHHLSMDGDTMTMMQAVLDTNFWLATHVVVITLGYSSTYLAGFLGIVFILRGVLTKGLERQESLNLSRMIYGIIAFATLFSFVGTILGGIWADQSWGRFWGWDPKENGALLIVLWNALVLHARWGGMARQRGIAALAVAGNIVTTWSWFGTNMLGVGLHAYGFIDSAVFWMFVFALSQLVIIALAMLPPSRWRSPAFSRSS